MGLSNKRDREGGGAGGEHFNICAETINPSRGRMNVTVAAGRHPFISPAWIFFFLDSSMLHVVCNPVPGCSKQRVESLIICYCTWIER